MSSIVSERFFRGYGAEELIEKLKADGVEFKTRRTVEVCPECGGRCLCPLGCDGQVDYLIVEYEEGKDD